jgi:hypothetical protein
MHVGQTAKESQELDDTASISPREGSALLCVTGNASRLQQQLASSSFHVAIARKTSFRVIKLKSRIWSSDDNWWSRWAVNSWPLYMNARVWSLIKIDQHFKQYCIGFFFSTRTRASASRTVLYTPPCDHMIEKNMHRIIVRNRHIWTAGQGAWENTKKASVTYSHCLLNLCVVYRGLIIGEAA